MNYAMFHKTDITKQIATYFLQKYLPQLKWRDHKEHILEIGCADGSVTGNILYPRIRNRVEKILATDVLKGMIDFARKENKIPQIDYQVLDVTDSRATSRYRNQFDHIFSFLVAQLIQDNRQFFASLRDMLKQDGQIFVTTLPNNIAVRNFCKQLEEEKWKKYAQKKSVFPHYTDDPEKFVGRLLTDVGFKIDVCKHYTMTYTVERFKDLIAGLCHMYIQLTDMSTELQEDFIQEHIDKCVAESTYLGEPDRYDVVYEQLICIASRTT